MGPVDIDYSVFIARYRFCDVEHSIRRYHDVACSYLDDLFWRRVFLEKHQVNYEIHVSWINLDCSSYRTVFSYTSRR